LCGEGAVRAHLDDGDRTARVAREVASWLRVRRLASELVDVAPEARAANAASPERRLLDQTRALAEEADLLERALRESPVAVLQADATGSVRFIGHAMRHALEVANVSLSHTASEGP